ncbi:selenocysteine insertion sequence-binding protein 2 [Condylostylus longicornis]|uniref:selenocysteine insertion sequence-binding protein 2 n=1 Tax=Condylostylus longicornis TaxID=2530218 RepID=UPI00244DDD4B|nr:selenocysteine insertion sequence-binding protein 2 [Condylostylus longicornis]
MSDSINNLCSMAHKEGIKNSKILKEEFSQTTDQNNQDFMVPSREEVIRKRKERNKAKKDAKAIERESKLLEEKLKKSEKIKTLIHEDFEKIQANQNVQQKPKYKKLHTFNILDYIVTKNVKRRHKTFNNNTNNRLPKFQIKSGKKREKKIKTARSRLKKAIIRARLLRKQSKNEEIVEGGKISIMECKESLPDQESIINNEENGHMSSNLENVIIKLDELKVDDRKNLRKTIHSRKFRSYCDNLTSSVLRKLTEDLIRKIYVFQKRAYQKNEIKAKAHRRYVMGFKETKRGLSIGKVKLVIIAPDCEQCDNTDGIQETIDWIKDKCNENEVPYLFSLRARQIAYCLYIKVPVYCLGIISYDGAQDIYNELLKCLIIERQNYLELLNDEKFVYNEIVEDN